MRYLILFLLAFGFFSVIRKINDGFFMWEEVKGTGPLVITNRVVSTFRRIECQIAADVEIYPSSEDRVEIWSQENIMGRIETTVKDGTLILSFKGNNLSSSDDSKIKIYTASPLLGLTQTASGNIHGMSTFSSETLTIDIQGSGNVLFDGVETKRAEVSVSGSGNVEVATGHTETLNVSLSGSGDLTFNKWQSQRAEVNISGSGDVRCYATDELKASISGSGDILYRGSPRVQSSVSGSGDILGNGTVGNGANNNTDDDGRAK